MYKQYPLYKFLYHLKEDGQIKKVLDCGAGGSNPPLGLIKAYGYDAIGIDIDEDQLRTSYLADSSLNIIKGDMREIPFSNQTFDAAYSYNSIFHMKKEDVRKSLNEMMRIIRSEGLLYFNVLSVDDGCCGTGKHLDNQQYVQLEGKPVIHSYFTDHELDDVFTIHQILWKEKRMVYKTGAPNECYIDYIIKKR